MGEITQLLDNARGGEPGAWDRVVTLLYEELLRVARRARRQHAAATLNPTALVNECYLRVAKRQAEAIDNREHFLAVAARAMRQILVNYARDRIAVKRGAGALRVTFDEARLRADAEADQLLELDHALAQLASEDVRLVKVVDCRVFGGLNETETAAALGVSLRTTQRLWADARARLHALLEDCP